MTRYISFHKRRIVYVTLIGVVGALHYEPLWLFVPVTPIWLALLLDAEEQRIWTEAWEQFREQLRMMTREGK